MEYTAENESWKLNHCIYDLFYNLSLRLLVKQRVIFDKFCWKFNKHLLHIEASVLSYMLLSIHQIWCVVQVDAIHKKKQQIRCLFKMNFKNWLILCVCFFSFHWKKKETVINHTNGKQMKMNSTIQWPNIHIYTYRMQKSWLLFLINKSLS